MLQKRQKKTYLDMFLDNQTTTKKREKYFEELQEDAIVKYNDPGTSQRERGELFEKIISTAFRRTINGVLEMPKFRNLPKALNRETLIEDTFFRLIEKIYKFQPGRIGKSGQPVKAFSYFSTIAKNYIVEQIVRHNKILKNKADVEHSIDLSILSEEVLTEISDIESNEVVIDDYISIFNSTKRQIIDIVKELIIEEESYEKRDEEFIKLGYCLKYLLEKWDKIEFMKRNEFMRILTLYTGFPQQKVSFLFKRFKIAVAKKIKPSTVNKNKKIKIEELFEEELFEENLETSEDELDEIPVEEEVALVEDEEEKISKYQVFSMDDWETKEYKLSNARFRKQWQKGKKQK